MSNPAPPSPEANEVSWVVRLANAISRSILFLIVAACVLAFLFPQSAHDLRRLHPPGFESLRLSKVLLAILLFAAGHEIDRRQILLAVRRPLVLLLAILLLWGVPLAGVVLLRAAGSSVLPPDLIEGLAIAGLMPAAVSSVSWAVLRGGNSALSLTLVFMSILVYPVIALFAHEVGIVEKTPTRSVIESIVLVAAATTLGAGVRWLFEARRSTTAAACLKILSSASLLLLNFINAAAAKPVLRGEGAAATIVLAAATVALVCGFGYLAAWTSTRWLRVDAASSESILFGVGMKNTGMALALSDTLLADQPIAVLTILFYTLTQHFFAATYHTFAPMPLTQSGNDPQL